MRMKSHHWLLLIAVAVGMYLVGAKYPAFAHKVGL